MLENNEPEELKERTKRPIEIDPNSTAALIYDVYLKRRRDYNPKSKRIGASEIGENCTRKIWYNLHMVKKPAIEPRAARLLDTGVREEDRIINDLITAQNSEPNKTGLQISNRNEQGKQWNAEFCNGYGVAYADLFGKGFPEDPDNWYLVDVKSVKTKDFSKYVRHKNDLMEANSIYYAQLQLMMHLFQIPLSALIVVCKDTDEIQWVTCPYNKMHAEHYISVAETVILLDSPPPRISDKPNKWPCAHCDYNEICHGKKLPEVNCRTCMNVQAWGYEGKWKCCLSAGDGPSIMDIPFDVQKIGCDNHVYNHDLLANFANYVGNKGNANIYRLIEDASKTFINGNGGGEEYTSKELRDSEFASILPDPKVQQLKTIFDGKVVPNDNSSYVEAKPITPPMTSKEIAARTKVESAVIQGKAMKLKGAKMTMDDITKSVNNKLGGNFK